ncbi:MAG TPA: alpha/beta hydrolase [Thermoanaerobaculia bacterium]|nr:alpha/beta hydrolase [Thermoanaerobaculia bacterium]
MAANAPETTVAPGDEIAPAVAPVSSASKNWFSLLGRIAIPSIALVAGGGLSAYARNRFQTAHLFAPDRYPLGFWNPEAHGLPAEDEWFEAEDGARLHGWWIPHPSAWGTILYCHGNNGNITNRIEAFQSLRRLGVHLFAFDYRGYGRSEGVPTEGGVYRDVRAAWDHLVAKHEGPKSIILFGHSLGGAVAIDGALHREVAGLVVQSSFTQVRDMARTIYPSLPLHLIARNQFRSIDKVGRLRMPKLFIHGSEDATVPIDHGRRLFAAAAAPKEWYEVARAGHSELHRHGGLRYYGRLQRFGRLCLSS